MGIPAWHRAGARPCQGQRPGVWVTQEEQQLPLFVARVCIVEAEHLDCWGEWLGGGLDGTQGSADGSVTPSVPCSLDNAAFHHTHRMGFVPPCVSPLSLYKGFLRGCRHCSMTWGGFHLCQE